jgi:hypothetical protein
MLSTVDLATHLVVSRLGGSGPESGLNGPPISGKFLPCTPPSECPHALASKLSTFTRTGGNKVTYTAWIISALEKPALVKAAKENSNVSAGPGTPAGPGPVASILPIRRGRSLWVPSQLAKEVIRP